MLQRERDGQILAPNGSIASANKRKGSPCQQDGDSSYHSGGLPLCTVSKKDGDSSFLKENGDGDSQAGKTMICSIPDLPEGIICLRIPCELQRFSRLRICACMRLKLIESKAPNLSTLDLDGKPKLSLGKALQLKNLRMYQSNILCYARTELPSIMPNLDTLDLSSGDEVVNTPMLPTKFLCLKHLTICLPRSFPWPYDYFSLVSFLDVSPSLETLSLDVPKKAMEDESIFRYSSDLRQMAEDHHRSLKNVKITGFSSAKSLVELTCYILKNAVSLECLALDTHDGSTLRCSDTDRIVRQCIPVSNSLRVKRRALVAIRKFIEDKVPAGVKLTVVEPCSRCH
ncbi:uncharacterized protein C2845_PM01G01880 [Panicum miliaceum]|uniref:At1g61320/AtMIF1 LRR domain-containing protein n=1 Tax=Panicum miliaceum TaxID=4540 RepID=A0A3L6TNQ8_PANMI|nr:uncharacterized protein C2845_PM01G01880 [Panicum miliaceum]